MHFASPVPLWLAALFALGVAGLSYFAYRRPLIPLSVAQRGTLMALRASTLTTLLVLLCRPTVVLPARQGDVVIPVLVDTSGSMRIPDGDNHESRMDVASRVLRQQLLPSLARRFAIDVYAVQDSLTPVAADLPQLSASGRRTALQSALEAVRERYRGRRVSGIVLLSDGGDTGPDLASSDEAGGPPVFAIGIGGLAGVPDREVLSVSSGDPQLDQSSVDLRVSAVSYGYGRAPFELRVRADGKEIHNRLVTPAAEGAPVETTFTVSPNPAAANVYTVEVSAPASANPAAAPDIIAENNVRTLIVSPVGRKRRILALEGAPGFEHSFMRRAFAKDPGLEVDLIVRKGKNESGRDTFLVQAGAGRAATLTEGFPARKEDLFSYDAIIVANVEGDFFKSTQLTAMADFVSERGGGLLVLGGRSFSQRGLIGTPLEPVLPVELNDRRGGLGRNVAAGELSVRENMLTLTPEGIQHPVMRIAASSDESKKLWAALPSLAATAPLGGPRPGASVLAVTSGPAGVYPVVAVQRFGRGRSMVFGGEGAWRWRMLQPATDRSFEFFWRQTMRWLAGPSPEPVTVALPDVSEPGDSVSIAIETRDALFAPTVDATLEATLTPPGGDSRVLNPRRDSGAVGRYTAVAALDQPGLYRVHAESRLGKTSLGAVDRWFYVGGSSREFAEPRLNEGVLRRIAVASGGRYVTAQDAASVVSWLDEAVPQRSDPERRDLWHEPWVYIAVILLLSAEWTLRRRWGLR